MLAPIDLAPIKTLVKIRWDGEARHDASNIEATIGFAFLRNSIHAPRPNDMQDSPISMLAETAAETRARQLPDATKHSGRSNPSCGLITSVPRRAPERIGRLSTWRSPPRITAVVRAPFCPANAFSPTAGLISMIAQLALVRPPERNTAQSNARVATVYRRNPGKSGSADSGTATSRIGGGYGHICSGKPTPNIDLKVAANASRSYRRANLPTAAK
jgi:hypothetical protein